VIRTLTQAILVGFIVEMSVAEFVALQGLSDRRRREELGMPSTCKPAITATKAVEGRVHVLVTCLPPEPDAVLRPR
jgi:hypothetical protein